MSSAGIAEGAMRVLPLEHVLHQGGWVGLEDFRQVRLAWSRQRQCPGLFFSDTNLEERRDCK